MIPVVVTSNTLYNIMMLEKFAVLCQYLSEQSTIELIAPANINSLVREEYGTYGSLGVLSKGATPTTENLNLMKELMRIIKLVNVEDTTGEYKKYGKNAIYMKLSDQVQAFGIWHDFSFYYKSDIRDYGVEKPIIPFIPSSEILQYIDKDMDFLLNEKR